MSNHAAEKLEQIVDLGQALFEQPNLRMLDLVDYRPGRSPRTLLLVRAFDILLCSDQEHPRIMILGQSGDCVLMAHRAAEGSEESMWLFHEDLQEAPGFRICSYEEHGRTVTLYVQKGIDVYDGDGVRV